MEGSNSARSEAIVIISSDEDEEENVQELFKEFVSKVERYVEQSVVVFLKLKFAEARSEFVSSAKFKNALKWRTRQMEDSNGYIYTGDICKLLATDLKTDDCKKESDCGEEVVGDAVARNDDVAIHSSRVEADVNKGIIQVTIDNCEEDDSTTVSERISTEISSPRPSTSTAQPSTSVNGEGKIKRKRKPTETPSPSKKNLTPQKRKKLVKRLKLKLKHVSDQIKILNQAELSLEEMEMCDSTYIQEGRLKERFNRIWDKICQLQGKPPDTGRVTENEVRCRTTRLPVIDRAINKFLKERKNRFPDIFDVSNVVMEANKKHGLKLSNHAINEMSDDVFMCIGNKLQKRRKRDLNLNFGCFLTDDYHPSKDPAINDLSLRKKLEENKRVSKRALDDVFNKFTHYGRMKTRENSGSSSSSDSEETNPENSEKVALKRKFSQISNTQSSDSSENECDDFGLEEEEDGSDDPDRSKEELEYGSTPEKSVEEKLKKRQSIRKVSDTSENDLEDFIIKTPLQVSRNKEPTENDTASDPTNLSENCAVVELPVSVLPEGDDISVERTAIVEIDCTLQHSEIEPTEQANVSEKDDNNACVSEDQEITAVQHIPRGDALSKSSQGSGSEKKSDSNVSSLRKEDLTTESSDISATSQQSQSQSVSSDVLISIDDSDDKPEVLSDTAAGSSQSSNFVDSGEEVIAARSPLVNGRHESKKNKNFDVKTSPSVSIPLTPVSLKGRKPLFLLSTKKRKAENGSLEYESPLKIFRNATLEIVGKNEDASLNNTETVHQKSSCNGSVALSENGSDELPAAAVTNSPPAKATINGHSNLEKTVSRIKLALSLNKSGRNSPKKVVERTSDVIVLSDDDSDS